MQEQEKPSYLKGAAILTATSIFVKIIGAIYKIPLFQDSVLGDEGAGDFNVTYSVYSLILTISTAGIPAALSRLVSSANAREDGTLVRRYFSVAVTCFFAIGLIATLIMFFFAQELANAMNNSMAALGIRVLAPAVLFASIISVYRGYAQGFQNMVPTAVSQIVEVLSKAVFGIIFALWFVRLGYEAHVVSAGAIVGVTIGLGLCIPLLMWLKRRIDEKIKTAKSKQKSEVPPANRIFGQIMKVSIPITLSAAFMSIMVVIDNSIVLGRLQSALHMTETGARGLFGIYSKALSVYNLVPALLVPVSVSIIPAIAAARALKNTNEAKSIMQSSVKIVNLIAMPAAAGLMVLASPILIALYNDSREISSQIMTILGAATFFVCLQYITTAILQANGHERISLITFPVGAAAKIILTWFLAGNKSFGILASPIGTLVCFFIISVLNIIFIIIKLKDNRPKFLKVFAGPGGCSLIMAGIVFGIYSMLTHFAADFAGGGRIQAILFLAVAVGVGISAYGVMIIFTRVITMEDMKLIPKGEKIGKFLKVRRA